ncbi:sigma-70 family RNA polymerase sigma factor [uncultured Pedobacter sp.]|uniref:RNA polymerase sigma factor n=2 Tax=Pedobacter TaxID=84567 RepID=UPI00260A27B8|nr:sigma-70 family RNA polymerase sigma factor [uncultured Pedobacter sp.]
MALYDLTMEKLLLKEISDGNSLAFNKMFSLYRGKILAFVDSFIHSKADAEEIVQETFLVIWKNKDKLLQIEHPRNYIYMIARNKTYDYLAKVSRSEKSIKEAWINTSISSNNIEDQIRLKESAMLIDKAIRKLSVQKQEIFNMSRSLHMSHEEIAQEIGLSKSRVKNVIVEVLKHLKYHIAKHNLIIFMVAFFKLYH